MIAKRENAATRLWGIALLLACQLQAGEEGWAPMQVAVEGRKTEVFRHQTRADWGYEKPQTDTFVVVHPKAPRQQAPLYVVLHSAGHDVWKALACTRQVGNHDIYRSPDGFYALYLDCRANRGDWWWGGRNPRASGAEAEKAGVALSPVERRVIGTVEWMLETYDVDPNRVYLCGNSMGGSGTLGIGVRHGDIFAAIKANVPAGIEHVSDRMDLSAPTSPDGVSIADPPIVIDYSGVNDLWSVRHEDFARAMNDRNYPLFLYWGPFGHGNNHAQIMSVNDLINSFDWLSIRKDQAYPVFRNASCNDKLPGFGDRQSKALGQMNAFFRWQHGVDNATRFEMSLYLVSKEELETRFTIPTTATADVSVRRLQAFPVSPGETLRWQFGDVQGEATADAAGLITIPSLTITSVSQALVLTKRAH